MHRPVRRVLIANRGEIALRIIRACRELGDRVRRGLLATPTPTRPTSGSPTSRSASGRRRPRRATCASTRSSTPRAPAGAEAIHPGYGFLAERAAFARAVEEPGSSFVGPRADAIDALGDKLAARRTARAAGVPVVPGTFEPAPIDRPDEVDGDRRRGGRRSASRSWSRPRPAAAAAACAGSGARRDLPAALAAGSREAPSAFGDGSVYLEREIRPARHVEVQLLGDADGTVVALGERDCSIQRRHQKLVEEAPAPGSRPRRARGAPRAGGPRPRAPRASQRRDRRVPARRRRPVLVPRGQRAAPGRARRDRARHRPRPRPRAALDRGRAAALGRGAGAAAARRDPDAPRDRGPPLGRGPGPRLRADAGPDRQLGDAGRARASGSTRRSRRGTGSRPSTTPDRQDHGRRRRPATRDRPAARAPSTRSESTGSRRPCRSTGALVRHAGVPGRGDLSTGLGRGALGRRRAEPAAAARCAALAAAAARPRRRGRHSAGVAPATSDRRAASLRKDDRPGVGLAGRDGRAAGHPSGGRR